MARLFYDLLKEINVTVSPQESLERMSRYYENEFFFLKFSDYDRVSVPDLPKQVREILKYIGKAKDFENLQRMITTGPITKKSYADFLASLEDRS